MSGLFGTFNIAKSGMFTQQKALDVTSHNLANTHTEGYSRQRAKITTTRPFATPSIHNSAEPGQLGTGSQIECIERIRDSFIDFQIRVGTSILGENNTKYKLLTEVEGVLNEPTDTGISNLMGEFFKAWHDVSKHTQGSNSRIVAAEKSASLASALNHSYVQFQQIKNNSKELTRGAVTEVNSMLDQIDKLNQEIIKISVAGKMPNDLMDKRDLLLDELSLKFSINVEKTNNQGINLKAEGYSLNMVKAVNNEVDVHRLSYIDSIEVKKDAAGQNTGEIQITYYKLGNKLDSENKVTTTLNVDKDKAAQIAKELEHSGVIWTNTKGEPVDTLGNSLGTITGSVLKLNDPKSFNNSIFKASKGELSGLMSIHKDVEGYEKDLNKLAKALAWSVNAIQTKGIDPAEQILFFVNKDGGTEDEIDASNIAINPEIIKDPMKIIVGKDKNSGESDNSRALAIAGLKDSFIMIQEIGSTINSRAELIPINGFDISPNEFFIKNNMQGMKIDSYFKDIVSSVGVKGQEAKNKVKTQTHVLSVIVESKISISGVSEDEEMTNLIQFQHSYQANAKVIATIDELLDVVINGLKR